MTDCYAVLGNPIAHSKSPMIHRLFAEQTNQDLTYEAILVDPEETSFQAKVAQLRAQGYQGLNITVPFKLDAFELADQLSERAQLAQAVNTFHFKGGKILGDNTDGIGLINDIELNAGFAIQGKTVLILGAGGAVQGILDPLLQKQPGLVHIANRTAKRAQVLSERFTTKCDLTSSDWASIPLLEQGYDLIINGTAASLEGKLLPIDPQLIGENSLVYDMMYGAEPTCFLDWAKQHQPQCQVRDGLGMLVGQAAEAFRIWRGVEPKMQPVIEAIQAQMRP
ncbi:shikimate dehydrogenase [Hydrogenovibrio sp. SC-1]|uniref:shikimate dehydrogenase n=1 Tax=Hydrogenovibrio sp. SC-1 TaxID=2065820 RepID=UPI000C7A7A84|nr:shikimate dehydrogenase [Hydrogenovibrio sp. SC-1]PLA74636.1 shikimate dehydrogenase [Hydrogenovibrio sp. SC-1]